MFIMPDDHDLLAEFQPSFIDPNIDREKEDAELEYFRKIADGYRTFYTDRLYPSEVLGIYLLQHNGTIFPYDPEQKIDRIISEWLKRIDKQKFKEDFECVMRDDKLIGDLFLLRLNYAMLLEPGRDEIVIHTNRTAHTAKLLFHDKLDAEGNYAGSLIAATEMTIEDLDKLSNAFYSEKTIHKSVETGTNDTLRTRINKLLLDHGYDIKTNLNEVYYDLNRKNQTYIEAGLIARIAYLIFVSTDNMGKLRLNLPFSS